MPTRPMPTREQVRRAREQVRRAWDLVRLYNSGAPGVSRELGHETGVGTDLARSALEQGVEYVVRVLEIGDGMAENRAMALEQERSMAVLDRLIESLPAARSLLARGSSVVQPLQVQGPDPRPEDTLTTGYAPQEGDILIKTATGENYTLQNGTWVANVEPSGPRSSVWDMILEEEDS